MENFYIHLIARCCIAVVGIFANLLGLIVLLQPVFRNKSTFLYLSALAVTDTAVLVWYPIQMTTWGFYPPFMASAVLAYFQQSSSSLLVAVTVDRCIIVIYPIRSHKLCTRRRAMIVMLVLFIAVPAPQLLGLLCVRNEQMPDSCYHIQTYLYAAMYVYLPCLILLVANISIIVRLRRRSQDMLDMTNANSSTETNREMSAAEKDDRKISVMLICTTVAFFVLLTPFGIARITNVSSFDKLYGNNIVETLIDIAVCNHAINMFIYCLTGRKFRAEAFKVASRLANHVKCVSIYPNNYNRMSPAALVSNQPITHRVIQVTSPQLSDISDSIGASVSNTLCTSSHSDTTCTSSV